jgi:hypothetical protein
MKSNAAENKSNLSPSQKATAVSQEENLMGQHVIGVDHGNKKGDEIQQKKLKGKQRSANGAAHNLARLALLGGGDCIWFENFPPSVMKIASVEQVQVMN